MSFWGPLFLALGAACSGTPAAVPPSGIPTARPFAATAPAAASLSAPSATATAPAPAPAPVPDPAGLDPAARAALEAAAKRCAPGLWLRTTTSSIPADAHDTRAACVELFRKPSATRSVLSERCKLKDDPGACMLLAVALAPHEWMVTEEFSVFVPPCKPKERCWTFVRSRTSSTPQGDLIDEAAATDALERACRGGVPASCEVLSGALGGTKKGDADEAQLRACALGMTLSCRKLVYEFRKRSLTLGAAPIDAVLKTEIASCDRVDGEGASCLTLATLRDIGWATEQQAGSSEGRLARGCSLGHGIACAKTVQLHVANKRRAAKPELEHAATVLGARCEADQPFTCAMLAVALKRGLGVPKDAARSAAVWKAACETPEKACKDLGFRP